MSSIDALTAAIRTAIERTRQAVSSLAASKEIADEIRDELAQMGVEAKADQAGTISGGLEDQRALVASAAERLEEILAAAEALRTDSGSGGGGGAPPGPPSVLAVGTPEPRPFKPMRTDPEKADEIRPYVGQPVAYATLYDEHGRQLVGVHNAGDDGPARDADWREPWGSMPRLRRHVEAHAAARMHRDGHRQLAIYVNLPPCSYPDGCKLNVADLLPKGTTLWMHQVRASGSVDVKPFRGTGRALGED